MSKLDQFGPTATPPAAPKETASEDKKRAMPVKGIQMRPEVMHHFRLLAAKRGVKEWDLMDEALSDLFQKYNEPL